MQSHKTLRVESELGLTHADFFRLLPRALDGHAYEVSTRSVQVEIGQGLLRIVLGEQRTRRIAGLAIPFVEAVFEFVDVSPARAQAFKEAFDRHYHRGGG